MKRSAIKKQLDRLDRLSVKAQESIQHTQKLIDYLGSKVHRAALRGENDFLDPALNYSEYRERAEFFDSADAPRIQALLDEASQLPQPAGQRWDNTRDVKIGIIADDFFFDSIEAAADFRPLTPTNFREVLPKCDLLLVVSAWRGLSGEWLGFGNRNSEPRKLYENEIEPLAREHSIPVAFYSKEDPPNFEKFIHLADTADFIFTSAEEVIPRYRDRVGDDVPIKSLRFAVNYRKHNPLGCERNDSRELVFAGSWLAHKYKERLRAATNIFDGIESSNSRLTIFDRNLNLRDDEFKDLTKYQYPDRFLESIRKPLSHDEVLRLQKLLPFAINLNSVTDSSTMFANRVVELLAMGTVVLSNYSNGVNSLYPYVTMIDSDTDARQFVDNISDDYIRFTRAEGLRDVFLYDTAFDRVDTLLESAGFVQSEPVHKIYIVSDSRKTYEEFAHSYPSLGDFCWLQPKEVTEVRGSSAGDVVVYADKIALKSPDLIADIITPFRYCDVDVVELVAFDDPASAYEIEAMAPGATVHAAWLAPGETIDSTPQLTKIRVRTSATCGASEYRSSKEPDISIIVPVYNNGRHLVHKCFQSLLRSSVFSRSKVLLIDDGSSDRKTLHVLDLLDEIFENVHVFRFPEGGSGSASRPRNKGLELADTKYVTYLDPDNEQTEDAYETLLEIMEVEAPDFALGNMVRYKGKRTLVNNSWALKKALKALDIQPTSDGKFDLRGKNDKLLRELNYQPMSIQALVAKREWLSGLGLIQPVGAVGQDSYFFQQMLYYAREIVLTPIPVHIYYAEVANSTVNSISPNFYRKYLPLEAARSAWLKEIGLHEHYSKGRFIKFLDLWYLKKLEQVELSQRAESLALIEEIAQIYGPVVTENSIYKKLMKRAWSELVVGDQDGTARWIVQKPESKGLKEKIRRGISRRLG